MYGSSYWQQEEVKTQVPDGFFVFFFNYRSKVTGDPEPLNLFPKGSSILKLGKTELNLSSEMELLARVDDSKIT